MPQGQNVEYLSFGDALFLHLEREGAPLNIASLAIFDGDISTKDFREFVASKLPLIPRYLQRVVLSPLNTGMPHWEFANDFNLSDHIREVNLKRGTTAELKSVTAEVLSSVLDRRHPLWDFTLIHGLKQGRTALIVRVHHCLADGISGIALINVFLDQSSTPPVIKRRKIRIPQPVNNGVDGDLFGNAMQSWFSTAERLLKAGGEVLSLVQRTTGLSRNGNLEPDGSVDDVGKLDPKPMARLAAELAELPQRLPFNVLCRGPQRYEWTEVPLADVKAMRERCGAMVNDVILALLTSAFRRYSELHGVDVRGRSLRIVVPVSTRRHHDCDSQLGNHITFAPFSAPLGVRSPKRLLSLVHERMQFVKNAHVAEFVAFAGTLLGVVPPPFQAILAPMLSEMPISLCNTICTNVPGPKKPLYLMGHEMLSAYPYVPIGGEMGVNCAVLSYNGTVYFGFTGDVHAVPDLHKFPKFVDESFAELKRAVGLRTRMTTAGKRRAGNAGLGSEPQASSQPVPISPNSASETLVKAATFTSVA